VTSASVPIAVPSTDAALDMKTRHPTLPALRAKGGARWLHAKNHRAQGAQNWTAQRKLQDALLGVPQVLAPMSTALSAKSPCVQTETRILTRLPKMS